MSSINVSRLLPATGMPPCADGRQLSGLPPLTSLHLKLENQAIIINGATTGIGLAALNWLQSAAQQTIWWVNKHVSPAKPRDTCLLDYGIYLIAGLLTGFNLLANQVF